MKTDKFINGVARAFWRRIEPYKDKFEKELPESLPVEFMSFMGTALSQLEDHVLVWTYTPNEPNDNQECLLEYENKHVIGYYNDVQKVFATANNHYVYLSEVVRWAGLNK